MTRPILATNDDFATIRVDVASARALGLTEEGIARLVRDAQVTAKVLARATGTRWTVERAEPAEVTGETITDEQIRELRASVMGGSPLAEDCDHALAPPRDAGFDSLDESDDAERDARIEDARARCAAAYNARLGARP